VDGLLWFTTAIQDGAVKFNVFCVNFWLCFPMFVTDFFYDNHIFVVYMTFSVKTTDVQANNVKHLRYVTWPKPFSGLPSHPIQQITCVSAITAVAAQSIAIKY